MGNISYDYIDKSHEEAVSLTRQPMFLLVSSLLLVNFNNFIYMESNINFVTDMFKRAFRSLIIILHHFCVFAQKKGHQNITMTVCEK